MLFVDPCEPQIQVLFALKTLRLVFARHVELCRQWCDLSRYVTSEHLVQHKRRDLVYDENNSGSCGLFMNSSYVRQLEKIAEFCLQRNKRSLYLNLLSYFRDVQTSVLVHFQQIDSKISDLVAHIEILHRNANELDQPSNRMDVDAGSV